MGRMKLGIGVAGAVIVILGVVAAVTMSGKNGSDDATKVVTPAAAESTGVAPIALMPTVPPTSPAQASQPSAAPAAPATTAGKADPAKTGSTVALPAQPTADDIQKVIAGITSQLLAPANSSATTKPLTKEELEAQIREQLRQLGINI